MRRKHRNDYNHGRDGWIGGNPRYGKHRGHRRGSRAKDKMINFSADGGTSIMDYPYMLPDGTHFRIGGNNDTAFLLCADVDYNVVVGTYEKEEPLWEEYATPDEAAQALITSVTQRIANDVW